MVPVSRKSASVFTELRLMVRARISHEMREKARTLRHRMTRAEQRLRYELRDMKAAGPRFRRQAPIGPHTVDFICLMAKRVVEVDGDTHETDKGKLHDANRDAHLRSPGFEVMRVDEPDVLANVWHVAQVVKDKAEAIVGDPTRPLRGHPRLRGEGKVAAFFEDGNR